MLSENPTSFTITVTSEAGENDESKWNALKCLPQIKSPIDRFCIKIKDIFFSKGDMVIVGCVGLCSKINLVIFLRL